MPLMVTGLRQAINFNRKVSSDAELNKMHEDIVRDTVSLMRQYAAVASGEMMHSIRYEKVGKNRFKIIVDVPWAIYQEYGTKYMPAGTPENPKPVISTSGKSAFRPFMRPAVFVMNNEFPEYIRRVFVGFQK